MNRRLMVALLCGLVMTLAPGCESMGSTDLFGASDSKVDIENAAPGTASALLGMDRTDIFNAARAAMSKEGQLLGAWPDSGRLEGVIDATSVVVSLLPVDRGLTRMLVEAAPLAGSGDVSSIATRLLQSSIAQLTGIPAGL